MGERFPFSIPNGWFQVAYSDELEPGGVAPLHYFGQDLVLFRGQGGEVKGEIRVEAHGMGCTITRFTGICETVLLLSHTPIDGCSVDSRFSFTQRKADEGSGVAAAVINEVVRQMNQDIPIWEHKKYLPKPMLCDGDGPIPEYRKWASQFYC